MGCRRAILGLAIASVVSGPNDATAHETRGSRAPVAFGFTDKTGTRVSLSGRNSRRRLTRVR